MPVRVGINGFGRTGRATFRAAHERDAAIEWAGINDVMDIEMLAHLLRHDSVYGPFPGQVEALDGAISVDGHEIPVFAAAAHLGDRRQLNHYVLGGSHDAANQAPNRGDIAKSIRAQNVDCPIVTSVSGRGRDAYGQVFRVRCGPVRGTSSDGFPYLSVTIQSNGEAVISPE